MGFLGAYTRGEAVRLWANFIDLDGAPVEPDGSSATVIVNQGNTELVNASMTQLGVGSNVFYYDYTVPTTPTEGVVLVRYQATIDGSTAEASDFFEIDLMKSHVLENRLGNQRILFYPATSADPVRNTVAGVLDYQIIQTKYDDDADWSTPRSSKTLWFYYENSGDFNPIKVGGPP